MTDRTDRQTEVLYFTGPSLNSKIVQDGKKECKKYLYNHIMFTEDIFSFNRPDVGYMIDPDDVFRSQLDAIGGCRLVRYHPSPATRTC